MSTTVSPTPAAPVPMQSVADFLDDLLVMRQRRETPEGRADCKWWREQIRVLAERAPRPAAAATASEPAAA